MARIDAASQPVEDQHVPPANTKPSHLTSDEVPVTRGMLAGVRTELLQRIDQSREEAKAANQKLDGKIDAVRAEIVELKAELKSEIHGMKADIHEVKTEIHGMKADIHGMKADIHEVKTEIHGMKAEIHGMKAEIHEVKAEIHEVKAEIHEVKAGMARIEVLVEEQNARNRIVLDGITALLSRQDQVEQRVTQVEETVRKLATAPPAG